MEHSVVPVALAPDARNGLPGERLLVIDIIDAEGLVLLRTTWAITAERRGGRQLTRIEDVASQAALMARLAELTAVLWPCREAPKIAIRA